jgi:catechol 2,3-dioxygenase-like lactoylglutathione lyase family enzyme
LWVSSKNCKNAAIAAKQHGVCSVNLFGNEAWLTKAFCNPGLKYGAHSTYLNGKRTRQRRNGSILFAFSFTPQGPRVAFQKSDFRTKGTQGGNTMATLQQEAQTRDAATKGSIAKVAHKLEVLVLPVSDVERAKEFYANLGWRLDADYDNGSDFRVIQFTPTGSGCSVIFGRNVTAAAPGSAQGLYLVVSDVAAAREELLGRGVKVSDVFHDAAGVYAGPDEPYLFGRLRIAGPDPDHRSYRSFASFRDPDGNGWLFQEITTRLPGRVTGDTKYPSATELSQAMRRASAAHGEHEKRIGQADPNWPDWYAEYMVREQSGEELPK